VGFDTTDQRLIRFFVLVRYWRKKWTYTEKVHQLLVDFRKAYDSVRREVLYNTVIDFLIPKEHVRIIKICLHETYNKARTRKYLSRTFPAQNDLKQGDALPSMLFTFYLEYVIRKVQKNQVRLKLDGTYQLLVHADDANLLDDNRDATKKTQKLLLMLEMRLV
jgi:hypothetical protein